MFTARYLVKVMEEERGVLSRLVELILREREGIIYYKGTLLTECLQEKEGLKASLDELEEKRMAAAGGKTLHDIMKTAEPEIRENLVQLQQDIKVRAREARALGKANVLLYKQSLALMEQLRAGICNSKGQAYNQSGEVTGDPLAGKLVSSSA